MNSTSASRTDPTSGMDLPTRASLEHLVDLALAEDLGPGFDCTSESVIPPDASGTADLIARADGVICGLDVCRMVPARAGCQFDVGLYRVDGAPVTRGERVGTFSGPARSILMTERTILNFLGRLSGIATLTARFVAAVAGTAALIHDTRKTTPAWRLLEKYAVRCGGGTNHRIGLYDAVLIKDNHLAMLAATLPPGADVVAAAVQRAREWIAARADRLPRGGETPVQVEVDSLDLLSAALALRPDMILLDNMRLDAMAEAVRMRDARAPGVQLEASGGVRLETVRDIARTGVDRISAGALTHSAVTLDLALDWRLS